MTNSQLLKLTQSLTNKEVKALRSLLSSPFFNKRPEVSALFDYLIEHQGGAPEQLEKPNAYRQLRPGQSYDDQQMRLWMSWLLKLIERFLVLQAFETDQVAWDLELCRIYRQKQLDKHLARQLKRTHTHLQRATYQNAAFHQNAFALELESYRSLGQKGRMSTLNLQEVSDQLDTAYLSHKLQLACLTLTHQAVYKTEYELGLLPQILAYIDTRQLAAQPAIGLYYAAYRMLSESGATRFHHFKALLLTHGQRFPPDERGDLYLLGINFCIRQYNQGEPAYLRDELELYREGLEQELFYQNQHLSRFTYRNIVTVGLVLEEYVWVEDFIHSYRNRLAPQHRVSMHNFCLAYLAYSRKEYDEALLFLQKANYRDLLLNLAAKALSLKIYHELEETDLLYAHLDAMQQFIRRKEQLVYHHNHYLQLIYFTRRLHELPPGDRQRTDQLRQDIEATKELAEKRWLLAQLTLKKR